MIDAEFDDDPFGQLGDDLLFDDLVSDDVDTLQTTHKPTARKHRIDAKRQMKRMAREDGLREVLDGLPAAGESLHIVSAAKFDYWTWVPVLINWLGKTDHLYCTTWALSRANARELFSIWDAGAIRTSAVNILTGTYFKSRETDVYCYLVDAKKKTWLTIEGSANLTGNPRVEQYVLTNDRGLHDFHRAWMDEVLAAEADADG